METGHLLLRGRESSRKYQEDRLASTLCPWELAMFSSGFGSRERGFEAAASGLPVSPQERRPGGGEADLLALLTRR